MTLCSHCRLAGTALVTNDPMLRNTELSKVLHIVTCIRTATPINLFFPILSRFDQDSERDYAYGAPQVKTPQYTTKKKQRDMA